MFSDAVFLWIYSVGDHPLRCLFNGLIFSFFSNWITQIFKNQGVHAIEKATKMFSRLEKNRLNQEINKQKKELSQSDYEFLNCFYPSAFFPHCSSFIVYYLIVYDISDFTGKRVAARWPLFQYLFQYQTVNFR